MEKEKIGKRPPLWWTYVYLILTACIALGASVYAIFVMRGEARASLSIFFAWCALALTPTVVLSILFWKNRQWYRIGTKILFILWSGTAFWYWSVVPIYQFFFGLLLNEVQIGLFLFVYFWEVPIIGGVLFAYVCYRWFRPFRDYFEGKTKPVNPEKFYKDLLHYPILVGIWVFTCSIIGYFLGAGQLLFFGIASPVEAVKNIVNGFAVAIFISITFYLLIDILLNGVREKLKNDYPALPIVRRRFVQKVMVVSILTALGTVVLIGLVAFRSFQEIVRENTTIHMAELIPVVSKTFSEAGSYEDEMRALEIFKYGEHGMVFTLPNEKVPSFSDFSRETIQFIEKNKEGSIQDLKGGIELVSFFKPDNSRVAFSLVVLPDFYRPFFGPISIFVLGVIFVLFMTLGVSIFISLATTRSIRSLSESIHKIAPHSLTPPQIIHTGDEIQELSESLFEYITEVQQLDQAKNDFILASQHNLRTPLTITKGYVEEIGAKTQSLNNAELNTFIEKTKKSLDILAQLVNGLIDITDLKVGKGGFSKEKDSKR